MFHFLENIFRWTESPYSARDSRMDLEHVVRDLVRQEQENDLRLNLRQVASKVKVNYKRLWHFMSETQPGKLSVAEVQAIYEKLSGKPLLPR